MYWLQLHKSGRCNLAATPALSSFIACPSTPRSEPRREAPGLPPRSTMGTTIGRPSADYRPTMGRPWSDHGPTTGRPSADHRPIMGRPWADYEPTIDRLRADHGSTTRRPWPVGGRFGRSPRRAPPRARPARPAIRCLLHNALNT